jgi:hypothetical protein
MYSAFTASGTGWGTKAVNARFVKATESLVAGYFEFSESFKTMPNVRAARMIIPQRHELPGRTTCGNPMVPA